MPHSNLSLGHNLNNTFSVVCLRFCQRLCKNKLSLKSYLLGLRVGRGYVISFYRLGPETDVGVAPGQEEVLESSG